MQPSKMYRPDFLKLFAKYRKGAPTILGPGLSGRELFTIEGEAPTVLYNMDMTYAVPFCIGIALASEFPKVVAIEGDGSMLAGIPVLTTIGRYRPANLTLIVLDNEAYGSFGYGEMASATSCGVDLEQIARACGISATATVRTLEEADHVLDQALSLPGPWVVIAKVEARGHTSLEFAGVPPDVADAGVRFYQAIRPK